MRHSLNEIALNNKFARNSPLRIIKCINFGFGYNTPNYPGIIVYKRYEN